MIEEDVVERKAAGIEDAAARGGEGGGGRSGLAILDLQVLQGHVGARARLDDPIRPAGIKDGPVPVDDHLVSGGGDVQFT